MATVHFMSGPPPETMVADVQNINRLNDEQFQEILNVVFEFLTDSSKASRMISRLEEFSEENGISVAGVKNVTRTLVAIPTGAMKCNLGAAQLQEDLLTLGMSEEKAALFAEQWRVHQVSLSRVSLGNTLMVNQLVDMDWKFAVTAGSSDMERVGHTFLQLKLVINNGNTLENHYMELTLPQFYSFLHEMEKAKASLKYLC